MPPVECLSYFQVVIDSSFKFLLFFFQVIGFCLLPQSSESALSVLKFCSSCHGKFLCFTEFHLTRRVGRNVTLAIDHLIHVRLRIVTTACATPARDCVTGNPGCATISTAGPCRVTCRGGSISSQLEFQVLYGPRRPPGWADVTDRSVPPSQKILQWCCDHHYSYDPKLRL